MCVLAVSKQQPIEAIRALADLGQRAFGENYVKEAVEKKASLPDPDLVWHLIGPLQSNKCAVAARTFDWIQSVDREKIVPLLARHRAGLPPLDVLIQVNIDDEDSKSGVAPDGIAALAASIVSHPELRLRGLMAIPAPRSIDDRRAAFRHMRDLFDRLAREYAHIDTLSLGMSDDFDIAIAEGANLVRVGSALFGARGRT